MVRKCVLRLCVWVFVLVFTHQFISRVACSSFHAHQVSHHDTSVCHRADQVIFRFQFLVVTDRASVLMFWGFEHYTLGLTSGLIHLTEVFVGAVLIPCGA